MKMSKLDRLGIEVSKLGFGCMRLPMKGDAIDREQALAMSRGYRLRASPTNGSEVPPR